MLDALDERYKFVVPDSLVEMEFNGIWGEFEAERKQGRKDPDTENKSDDELRGEFKTIAERRVRLGLLLAEIGQSAGVSISDDDMTQALVERARQFPGQEKAVWDYYRNNEQALAQLRAPLYEARVVAHLSGLVKLIDKPVSREELFADDEAAPAAAASGA